MSEAETLTRHLRGDVKEVRGCLQRFQYPAEAIQSSFWTVSPEIEYNYNDKKGFFLFWLRRQNSSKVSWHDIFFLQNLMLGSVLPSEASTLSLFSRENMQRCCGVFWADTLLEMLQCLTIYALNKKDKFPSLYISERWISCAWSILCSLLQHCKIQLKHRSWESQPRSPSSLLLPHTEALWLL